MLNKPLNGVFALTPDKRLGVNLASTFNGGEITSFDPLTGVKFDSEIVGFGPVEVDIVPSGDGYRVAALITQGGPRAVKIYDMDRGGILTFRAQTQLTDSNADSSSDMVLSAGAQVGFVRVVLNSSNLVVSFSLDNGNVLQRLGNVAGDSLKLYEDSNRRLLAAGRPNATVNRVVFIDAQNPAQMQNLGPVILPGTGISADLEFSADGNYLFAGGSTLTVIDTTLRQIVDSLDNYAAQKIRIYEQGNNRMLAIFPGASNGIALINASDVLNLQVVNEIGFTTLDSFLRDFTFSADGKRLFLNRDNSLKALSVPNLTTAWENTLPVNLGFRIESYGRPGRVIGAWGSNNNFGATIYSMPDRTNRRVNFGVDSKSDVGVFRPADGNWYWLDSSTNGFQAFHFGQNGDIPVPADYDNDGQTDFGVYRPAEGAWYIYEAATNTVRFQQLGAATDEPVPADYDGDGKADIAVFRRNPNRWYVIRSTDGALTVKKISGAAAKPVRGDFDGDGTDDFVVFYSSGQWQVINSSGGNSVFPTFGQPGDIPLSGDWDNDGKSDLAVFRPGNQTWYILQSFYGLRVNQFGFATDIPVPADYNGDGNLDIAVFRPSTATWFIFQGTNPFNPDVRILQFGLQTDVPLASRY